MSEKYFTNKASINCNGKLISLENPLVMGILNVTPDSFFDGGNYLQEKTCIAQVQKMLTEGVDIIDVGGYSSRPNAKDICIKEELTRVLPIVKSIRKQFPGVIISVDTFRSEVANATIGEGADMINDISGGTIDDEMFVTIGKLKVPYVLMHIQGIPQTMQHSPQYEKVVQEIIQFFSLQIAKAQQAGINDIIIDVGFGFGKTLENNYELLKNLSLFKMLDKPILVGVSRKGMIHKVLNTSADKALNGTTVLNTVALMKGANILRVHDVKEAKEAISLINFMNKTAL